VRLDPDGTPDSSKLTGLDILVPIDQVFDWMADRLADGPTGLVARGQLFRLGVDTALALCNDSLTCLYVDDSMRRHCVK
jgi:hypothetical protein